MIKEIELTRIKPHPSNPRMTGVDYNDLAQSIKALGVIQNLTVVPEDASAYSVNPQSYTGEYVSVIGHRRLEAAKLAGLQTVPCNIAELTEKEQIAAMLAENLQRTDLSLAEQGHGFQMMLELGVDIAEISTQTGVPKSGIKQKIRIINELGLENLRKVQARDVLITDYERLLKIKCPVKRAKVLEVIGTQNFDWGLEKAIREEEKEAAGRDFIRKLENFSKPAEKDELPPGSMLLRSFSKFDELDNTNLDHIQKESSERTQFRHVCKDDIVLLFVTDASEEVTVKDAPVSAGTPVSAEEVSVSAGPKADDMTGSPGRSAGAGRSLSEPLRGSDSELLAHASGIEVRAAGIKNEANEADEKKELYRAMIAKEDAKARKNKLLSLFAQAKAMRMSFAKRFIETDKTRDRVDTMIIFALLQNPRPDVGILEEVFGDFGWSGISFEARDNSISLLLQKYGKPSGNIRFLSAYCRMERSGEPGMTALDMDGNFLENKQLMRLYDHLCSLGYVMSEEETLLMNGGHPFYPKEKKI